MSRYWEVTVCKDDVFIEPPQEIDEAYDDLLLRVTGNMMEDKKIEIATHIVNALNAKIDS